MRLQQVDDAEPAIPGRDARFVRAKRNRLLEIGITPSTEPVRNLHQPIWAYGGGAAASREIAAHIRYRVGAARFGTQHLSSGIMRIIGVLGSRQGMRPSCLARCNRRCGKSLSFVERAHRQQCREPRRPLRPMRVELQGRFKILNRLV